MPELLTFDRDDSTDNDPKAREKALRTDFYDAWREVKHTNFDHGKYPDYLERRLRVLERTLRAIMASDALTDLQRAEALAVMFGAPGKLRDGKLLEDHETKLIQHYRAMDTAGRQMLRTLCDRLAATYEAKGGAR